MVSCIVFRVHFLLVCYLKKTSVVDFAKKESVRGINDMKIQEKMRKPVLEAKYLNVENTDRYRPIIRLFKQKTN